MAVSIHKINSSSFIAQNIPMSLSTTDDISNGFYHLFESHLHCARRNWNYLLFYVCWHHSLEKAILLTIKVFKQLFWHKYYFTYKWCPAFLKYIHKRSLHAHQTVLSLYPAAANENVLRAFQKLFFQVLLLRRKCPGNWNSCRWFFCAGNKVLVYCHYWDNPKHFYSSRTVLFLSI